MASDECTDILVDITYLAALQRRLKIDATDTGDVMREGRFALDALHEAVAASPSQEAWCKSVYRLYGPDGSMIPNLMRRAGQNHG